MCPQTWRHIAVAISREFIPPHKRPMQGDRLMDMASSHSTHVARGHYAITDGDLPMLTTDAIHEFQQIDEAWHNICGVGPSIPPPPLRNMTLGTMNGNVAQDSSIIKNLKDDLRVELVAELRTAVSEELASFKNAMLSSMQAILKDPLTHIQHATKPDGLPEIGQQNASSPLQWSQAALSQLPSLDTDGSTVLGHEFEVLANDGAQNDELEYLDPVAPSSAVAMECNRALQKRPLDMMDLEEGDQHISKRARVDAGHTSDQEAPILSPSLQQQSAPLGVNIQTRALVAIREVLQDPQAQPKSGEQLMIIVNVLEGKETFGVLPTGGGKSMVWQAVAKADPGSACAIICPYRFLLEEQLCSSEEKGFIVVRYKAGSEYPSDYQHMFLQPEQVKSKGFQL